MLRPTASSVAKHDTSRLNRDRTNPLVGTVFGGSEDVVELARDREAVPGQAVAARDCGFGAGASQRAGGDRLAVGQGLAAAEGGVAGADEDGCAARGQGEALPVVELAVCGTRRWSPVPLGDVAPDGRGFDVAADVAARGGERDQLVEDLVVLSRGRGLLSVMPAWVMEGAGSAGRSAHPARAATSASRPTAPARRAMA